VRDGRACFVKVHLVAADTPTGSRAVFVHHNPWASPAFMPGSNMGITSGLVTELRGFDECRLTGRTPICVESAVPASRFRGAGNGASTP
jgi:hypothetical protein